MAANYLAMDAVRGGQEAAEAGRPLKVFKVVMRPYRSVLCEVSKLPGVDVQVYSIVRAHDRAHTLVRCSLPDSRKAFPRLVDTLSRREEVLDYKVLERRSTFCTIVLTKNMCEFYEYTIASERHTFFPYTISKCLRTFYLLTTEGHEDLRRALSRHGSIIAVQKVTFQEALTETAKLLTTNMMKNALTPMQRRVLLEALRRGFFEWPRRISLEELSRELGVSKVTLSEHLRRGERKLLESIFGGASA